MKKNICILVPLFSVAGFVLRRLQLANSYDALGLIPRGDGLTIALNLLGVLGIAVVLLLCLRIPKADQSPLGGKPYAIGKLLSGALLLVSLLPPNMETPLSILVCVLGFCAVISLCLEAFLQLGRKTGSLIGGCVLTVYLMVSLIAQYLEWSYVHMAADFIFPLLFGICCMIASFRLAAFRVGKGLRRRTLFYGSCALMFAGPVLADGGLSSILRTCALCIFLFCSLWPQMTIHTPE